MANANWQNERESARGMASSSSSSNNEILTKVKSNTQQKWWLQAAISCEAQSVCVVCVCVFVSQLVNSAWLTAIFAGFAGSAGKSIRKPLANGQQEVCPVGHNRQRPSSIKSGAKFLCSVLPKGYGYNTIHTIDILTEGMSAGQTGN